jgi:hypothetical protein
MLKRLQNFCIAWVSSELRPTALKVVIVVGSLLFLLNHSGALIHGEMTCSRWLAAILTYFVPYTVSIHGQLSTRSRH